VISSFGGQVTMLALPLTAAVLLHASPTQMGLLTAMELVPFVLFRCPPASGSIASASCRSTSRRKHAGPCGGERPIAWWLGWLSMPWLYVCGLLIGTIYTVAGSAAQIVLTQVVARERLVEAHAKNALATSARRSPVRRRRRLDQGRSGRRWPSSWTPCC
jgi:hypothetical protein